jgi:hypothetical protein
MPFVHSIRHYFKNYFFKHSILKLLPCQETRQERNIDSIVALRKNNSPSHVFGDERVIVKYVQLYTLFPPLTLLREGKRYEVVSEIKI